MISLFYVFRRAANTESHEPLGVKHPPFLVCAWWKPLQAKDPREAMAIEKKKFSLHGCSGNGLNMGDGPPKWQFQ